MNARRIPREAMLVLLLSTVLPDLAAGHVPSGFVESVRSNGEPSSFTGRIGALGVRVDAGGITLVQPPRGGAAGHAVRLSFDGAREDAVIRGAQRLAGDVHLLIGPVERHRAHLPRWGAVVVEGLYPGVDLRVYDRGGRTEYDLLLGPGSRCSDITVRCEGVEGLSLDKDGALLQETPLGVIRQVPPSTWEVVDGTERAVECQYRILDEHTFGFVVEGRDPAHVLVIDPGVEWGTYLGGTGQDRVGDLALAPDGSVVVVGTTESLDFPTTPGVIERSPPAGSPARNALVCRLAPGGALVFATYLGGSSSTEALTVGVGPDGVILVGGSTFSADYPTTPGVLAESKAVGNGKDGFLTRLSDDGATIVASTFLGAALTSDVRQLEQLPSGDIVFRGRGLGMPATPGAFDPERRNSPADFVARVDRDFSSLEFATYFGGSADLTRALTLTANEDIVLVGLGSQPDGSPEGVPFTPGAFGTPQIGYIVASLSADGSSLRFCTQIGGILGAGVQDVAIDPFGNIVIVGGTSSWDYPLTADAIDIVGPDPGSLSIHEPFVTILDPTASRLLYSSYYGGPNADGAKRVIVDDSGAIIFAGGTVSFAFPVTPGAFDVVNDPVYGDPFIVKLAPDRHSAHYATLLGGSSNEESSVELAIALDPHGSLYFAVSTFSEDFPGIGADAIQPTKAGLYDAVIARLDLLPTGVQRFGTSTPGCQGPLVLGVTAMPQPGIEQFGITCTRAPPLSSGGLLAVATGALATPVLASGAGLWLDPGHIVNVLPLSSDVLGYSEFLTRAPSPPGLVAHVQAFWPDLCAPGGWSASTGMTLVVQP